MKNEILTPEVLDMLPEQLKIAQESIHLPEVEEMMKKLAKYNLGVFMPHQHNLKSGEFEVLEDGMVQVEDDLQISFLAKNESSQFQGIPVGWVWKESGITSASECVFKCRLETSPTTGGLVHIKNHK